MRLGEILVGRGLVTDAEIEAAMARQRIAGGRLGENLTALGYITEEQLESVINSAPATPAGLSETGIAPRSLLNLMIKFMHVEGVETVLDLAERMKLPRLIVQQLMDEATQLRFVQALGAAGSLALSIRFALSEQGRTEAKEALEISQYLGPAPVSLAAYQAQIARQRISNELLDAESMRKGFEGLVVPEHYIRKLLPAVSAGRSVLLFGPPGNGKTTLATRISGLFRDIVYVPYAVEVGGQIIKIFDPTLHKESAPKSLPSVSAFSLARSEFDERWVACRRPVAMAGGELTLEMLDLQYNPESRFYDAPLHVKAFNGMFLIDDFGRQKFSPNDLLNRWIVPMETQFDFLKLSSGASFSLPFDLLLIFSTNLQPSDLMDPAFLRRIQYKIKLFAPSREEYRQIFNAVAASRGLTLSDDVFDFIVDRLTRDTAFGLAYYQPRFICEQALEACKCFNLPLHLTRTLADEALSNLYFDIENSRDADNGSWPSPLSA